MINCGWGPWHKKCLIFVISSSTVVSQWVIIKSLSSTEQTHNNDKRLHSFFSGEEENERPAAQFDLACYTETLGKFPRPSSWRYAANIPKPPNRKLYRQIAATLTLTLACPTQDPAMARTTKTAAVKNRFIVILEYFLYFQTRNDSKIKLISGAL